MKPYPSEFSTRFHSRDELDVAIAHLQAAGFPPEALHQSILEHTADSLPFSGAGLAHGAVLGCLIGMILGWVSCSSIIGMKLLESGSGEVHSSAVLPTIECITIGGMEGMIVGLLISAALGTGPDHRKPGERIAVIYRLLIKCRDKKDKARAKAIIIANCHRKNMQQHTPTHTGKRRYLNDGRHAVNLHKSEKKRGR
jgi:hypothetical protein